MTIPSFDPQNPDALIGETFCRDTYRIEELCDSGGFAYVYRGTRISGPSDSPVAVKVLRAAPDEHSAERLQKEAQRQAQAGKDTDRIVNVFEVLPASENELRADLFVMEWVDGNNLYTVPAADQPPRERVVSLIDIAIDIARGLSALHSRNLWHGDLTPGNVLAYHKREDGWQAKLIDLGLTRHADYIGATAGSALYLAPEQLGTDREQYDSMRADLYALGAVLFHLFSGGQHYLASLNPPPAGPTLTEQERQHIFRAIRHEPPRQLSEFPHIPDALSALVDELLAKEPEQRTGSASEVREALEQIRRSLEPGIQTEAKVELPPLHSVSEWDVRLLAYEVRDDVLHAEPQPLGFLSQPGNSVSSPNLTAGGEQDTVQIVLTEHTSRELIYSAEFEVIWQPFSFEYFVNEDGNMEFRSDGLELKQVLDIPSPYEAFADVQFQKGPAATDVAFLIDGTMERDALDLARNFVWMATQWSASNVPARYALVAYGEYAEYQHPRQRRRRPPYDALVLDFANANTLQEYLKRRVVPDAAFAEQDIADAMELGLQKANNLGWKSPVQHLIIVGNSPPHPSEEERVRYSLLDFTTEGFEGMRWQQELQTHKEEGRLIRSYFVEPAAHVSRSHQRYLDVVWTTLDSEPLPLPRYLSNHNLTDAGEELVELIRSKRVERMVPAGDTPLPRVSS